MKKYTTIQKVSAGFALLTLLLVLAVGLALWQASRSQAITDQLVNQSAPMSDASLRVINGVNTAGLQLRGWVLLGDERYKAGRGEAFTKWIDPSLANLKALVASFGNATQQDQIKQVERGLKDWQDVQTKIEAIAGTAENLPANELTGEQAAPRADEIIAAVTAMIDAEVKLEASAERKVLLTQFANFRGSIARSLAKLREYLTSGDDSDRLALLQILADNALYFDQIEANTALLQGTQSTSWQKIVRARSELEKLLNQAIAIRQSEKWNLATSMLRLQTAPLSLEVRNALEQFISDLAPQNAANRDALVKQVSFLKWMQWCLLLVGILISTVLAWTIIRSIRFALAEVTSSTQEVRTSSSEIAAGSQQQVASLNETAASLNEITATAEEFKATMQEFSDRASAVQEAAKETAKQSSDGRELTRGSAQRIEQVRDNSHAAGESALRLAEQMQRIGEITATVNEIAEQTKLLALNASIEAARAGDEGRGFAVVATHVRELANQSKDAASRIESLISGTHQSLQDVVGKIEDGHRLAEESTSMVRQLTDAFDRIAQAIDQTTNAMSQISIGARQQEQGLVELVSSITQIDSASKESLASAEQTQRAILSIDKEISRLNQSVKTF